MVAHGRMILDQYQQNSSYSGTDHGVIQISFLRSWPLLDDPLNF